jgi:hypothetical protein
MIKYIVTKLSTNLKIKTYLRQWWPYKKNHTVYFPTNTTLKDKIEKKQLTNKTST